jgi:hypothetical protein
METPRHGYGVKYHTIIPEARSSQPSALNHGSHRVTPLNVRFFGSYFGLLLQYAS